MDYLGVFKSRDGPNCHCETFLVVDPNLATVVEEGIDRHRTIASSFRKILSGSSLRFPEQTEINIRFRDGNSISFYTVPNDYIRSLLEHLSIGGLSPPNYNTETRTITL